MVWGADELPVTRITKKVEEFRKKWVLVDVGGSNAFCDIPDAPPVKHDGWSSVPLAPQAMSVLVGRLKLLRDAGLTGQMVAVTSSSAASLPFTPTLSRCGCTRGRGTGCACTPSP